MKTINETPNDMAMKICQYSSMLASFMRECGGGDDVSFSWETCDGIRNVLLDIHSRAEYFLVDPRINELESLESLPDEAAN